MSALLRQIASAALVLVSSGPALAERWELQYFYDKLNEFLRIEELQFPSPQRGIAVGEMIRERRRTPVSLLTSDGGRTWQQLPLKEAPRSLFFLSERAGWMVTAKNHLWKTADTGRTWSAVALPRGRVTPVRLVFLDESRGWLLCAQKQVYQTSDGGRSWQLLPASQEPDAPAEDSVYTWGVFSQEVGLFSGWNRVPTRGPNPWTDPEVTVLGQPPTDALMLHSADRGITWKPHLVRKFGEIVRVRVSPAGAALMLLRHPDSLTRPTEMIELDLKSLRGKPVFANVNRWITDVIFAGPKRAFAVALDREGRSPIPNIPSRIRVMQSSNLRDWTEMDVDYRAEGQNAVLAVAGESDAWLATDAGMILRWAKD